MITRERRQEMIEECLIMARLDVEGRTSEDALSWYLNEAEKELNGLNDLDLMETYLAWSGVDTRPLLLRTA